MEGRNPDLISGIILDIICGRMETTKNLSQDS
jgi:hypothetical protein